MILKAKYVGPYASVEVPGFAHRTAKRDEVVTVRVPDGSVLGGPWEIVEGKEEYEKAIEAARERREAEAKAKADAAASDREAHLDALDKVTEQQDKAEAGLTTTRKSGKKG